MKQTSIRAKQDDLTLEKLNFLFHEDHSLTLTMKKNGYISVLPSPTSSEST
jgi:hypothetical protein